MSRRERITRGEQIDRGQRRRVTDARMWSEAPVPPDMRALPGAEGSNDLDPGWSDCTWLSWGSMWTDLSCEWGGGLFPPVWVSEGTASRAVISGFWQGGPRLVGDVEIVAGADGAADITVPAGWTTLLRTTVGDLRVVCAWRRLEQDYPATDPSFYPFNGSEALMGHGVTLRTNRTPALIDVQAHPGGGPFTHPAPSTEHAMQVVFARLTYNVGEPLPYAAADPSSANGTNVQISGYVPGVHMAMLGAYWPVGEWASVPGEIVPATTYTCYRYIQADAHAMTITVE